MSPPLESIRERKVYYIAVKPRSKSYSEKKVSDALNKLAADELYRNVGESPSNFSLKTYGRSLEYFKKYIDK